jgi:hypothetical protein
MMENFEMRLTWLAVVGVGSREWVKSGLSIDLVVEIARFPIVYEILSLAARKPP